MKKYKNYCIAAFLCLSVLSCAQDDDKYIGGSISGGETPVNSFYPVPPSQWMGGNEPYFSAGWVGDIMPYFDNGKFHIYFLHDAQSKPAGKGFHDIHKFESSDLASFTYKGQSIPFGETMDPDFAIGTGSVVKVGSMYYFYYTGHNGNNQFLTDNPRESVLCATSTDLTNWTKVPEFKITAPAGYYNFDFRDPHVFYNEEQSEYWMLISTQTDPAREAVVLLYTSNDPASGNWEVQEPIYTTTPQEDYLMLECADIFKMGNYWYLTFSESWSGTRGTHYRMATSATGPWTTPENDMLDGEYFYAAKTASDGNKRYAFGWTARKSPENDTGNKEWAGNMVIHELVQNTDGTLATKLPESVNSIFTQSNVPVMESAVGDVSNAGGTYTADGTNSESIAHFEAMGNKMKINAQVTLTEDTGSAGFIFHTNDDGDFYKIVFEPGEGRIAAYNSAAQQVTYLPMQITSGTVYTIEIITDGSVCVLYVNGKKALSNRIYGRQNNKWGIIAENNSINVSGLEVVRPE